MLSPSDRISHVFRVPSVQDTRQKNVVCVAGHSGNVFTFHQSSDMVRDIHGLGVDLDFEGNRIISAVYTADAAQ